MPRSGKSTNGRGQGIDVAVARALGRILDRPIEFHWCASAGCSWRCLPERRCDVVIGQPQGSGPRDVAWSVPYAAAQFGLVVRHELQGIRSLSDLRDKPVGIVTGTIAISEKDHAVVRFKSREELLGGFQSARLDAAFLDSDFAAWYLHQHPQPGLRQASEFVPRERWNMAIAVRAKDASLLVDLNRALAQLAESGELKKIYDEHGAPFRAPIGISTSQRLPSDVWPRIRERGELVVCMDPANLPYSSARPDRPGFDVELAQALAGYLKLKLRIEWLDVHHETAVGELLQGRCDLVFGEAVAANAVADDEPLVGKVLYSRPYYGTGYLLVERKDGPHVQSLAELKGKKSQRLGTEAGSMADYSLRQHGYLRRLYRNQLATLKALSDGDIDHAYLWANVGWTLHTSPEFKLQLVPGYVPVDHWNIAVGMRAGNDELRKQVDAALEHLIADGTVARALARYHVPHFLPFPEPTRGGQGSAEPTIRHAAADRGTEPKMQRIATSRHPYSAMERIRSADELVVGLDQNNLPFSTAHPKPAGLDYEIAGLLAQQLRVPLRVYWAYSSHDSYPSKLASKQLCDLILGVRPDDRFGQRVLYSRPYYVARYEIVVRCGEPLPSADEPMAVEEGVIARGLTGRKLRTYPSTEAILEAVAAGQARAGYVISTRARWLAAERWHGKLDFHALAGSDRLPICAAVRKADAELKAAIDHAWDELERSGRLGGVFSRWHISYEAGQSAKKPSP
jgi:ABC-type amino acid transport substrate-binding protein